MPMATLVDLPTELLLQILHDECLTHKDLYLTGLVSRRLNFVVVSLILELRGVSNLNDLVSLTLDRDSLPPLYRPMARETRSPFTPLGWMMTQWPELKLEALIMVAFYLSSIREVECTFPQSFTDSDALLRQLERFYIFIQRLTSVESLTLHFEGDHKHRHLSSNMFSAIPVPLAEVFGKIIKTATDRGCRRLRIYNKSHRLKDEYWSLIDDSLAPLSNTDYIPVQIPSKMTSSTNMLTKVKTKVENALFRRHPPTSSVDPRRPTSPYVLSSPSSIGQNGQLQDIHIQTPFALLPRCFPDVCNILLSSINTLTSLTLSHILFDEHLFESFLSTLSSVFLNTKNAVAHLSLQHCQKIPPKPLVDLLRCFQDHLQHLELDRELSFVGDDDGMPTGGLHFQELHTVTAPLDWLTFFIKNDTVGPPLPNLSTMTIRCRLPYAPDFTYEAFRPHVDAVIEPIYSRWKSSYHYQLPKVEVTLDLILDRRRPQQMERDCIIVNLQSSFSPISSKDTMSAGRILNPEKFIFSASPRPPQHWDLITKLELSPTYPPVDDTKAQMLSYWVTKVFPSVEQVTLPLPYIPRHMPAEQYKSRQLDIATDASIFLKNALQQRQLSDSEPVAWKALVVGPWSLSLEFD